MFDRVLNTPAISSDVVLKDELFWFSSSDQYPRCLPKSATNFSSLVGKNLWRSPFVVKIQTKALKFDINQLGSLRNKLLWILIRHLLSLLNPLHVAT